ncbi:unnamed protein product [Kluyveromyces dobzhanskii CBS 2104]|uniref:Pre-mRNA-splicing factor CWC25 n=1 Tax=Kluyveromyces dobzhanskii CBS 2104 TaxID=1427455 RepID=A0A0A8L3I7_9SACH|nr:unnamed protein product [Kluyveromyces dobzhanskii CBS 2104]
MSDLNLLKSWNPKLVKNRKKVWEAQQELLEENKKIKERQKEIEKERELERYTSLTRNGKDIAKKQTGLEWMYDDQSTALAENEDYLLGKKEITDTLITLAKDKKTNQEKDDKPQPSMRRKFNGVNDVIDSNPNSNQHDLSNDDPMAKFKTAKQKHMNTLKHQGFTSTTRTQSSYGKAREEGYKSRYNENSTRQPVNRNSRYNNKNYRK